jgi:hypothetical protein
MPLPGWNSIEVTGTASNWFFWLSIGALVLLGLAEVLQHRYGDRHDWLLAQKHQAEKDAGDGAIARLHLETSHAQAEQAKANERTAQLQLDLEREKEKRIGRGLTKDQWDALQELKGKITRINVMIETNMETVGFGGQIVTALQSAGIDVKKFPPVFEIWTGTLIWWRNFPNDATKDDPLVSAFFKAGLYGGQGNIDALFGKNIPRDAPLVMIGERPAEVKPGYWGPPKVPDPPPN